MSNDYFDLVSSSLCICLEQVILKKERDDEMTSADPKRESLEHITDASQIALKIKRELLKRE